MGGIHALLKAPRYRALPPQDVFDTFPYFKK